MVAKKEGLTAADYKVWQQACGFSYSKYGLLFDPLVRPIFKPVSSFTHDWMHCILSNGVFATCMFSWLEAIEPHMQIYKVLSDYLPLWHHPKHQACKLELLFADKNKKNNKESCTFKSTASEAVSLLPILSYFIQAVLWPANVCKKESKATWQGLFCFVCACCCTCFWHNSVLVFCSVGSNQVVVDLCSIVDILLSLPIVKIQSQHLEAAINTFFDACGHAGWQSIFHSKFHWLTHMPKEMVEMGGFLPSCFTQERKHKTVKKYATSIQNLKHYNRSILEEIAVQDLYDLQEQDFSNAARLANKGACSKKVLAFLQGAFPDVNGDQCYCCSKAKLSPAGSCSRGDMVLVQDASKLVAGEVMSNFEVCGTTWTLLQKMSLANYSEEKASAKWSRAEEAVVLIATENIQCAATWSNGKDDTIVTIIPLPLRGWFES